MKVGRGVKSQFDDIIFMEKVLEIQMVADLRGVGIKYWGKHVDIIYEVYGL